MTIPERIKWDLERCHPTVSKGAAGGDQPLALPFEIHLQSGPGPTDAQIGHGIQRIDLDFEIGKRISERIKKHLHHFLFPQGVVPGCFGGPRVWILAKIQALQDITAPAKAYLCAPSGLPT